MENSTIILSQKIHFPGKKPAIVTLEIAICNYYVNLYQESENRPLFSYKCMEYNNALHYMAIAKNKYERIESV